MADESIRADKRRRAIGKGFGEKGNTDGNLRIVAFGAALVASATAALAAAAFFVS